MIELMQGDCLERMKEIPDGSVDLVLTDPPYTTPTVTAFGRDIVRNYADFSIQESFVRCLKAEFERILKPNAPVFIFCDDKYYPSIFKVFYDWKSTQMIVWDKLNIGMGKPFRKRHELIFYANRAAMDYNRTEGISHYPTVLAYKPVGRERVHGAQKPVELVTDLIKGFTNEESVVFDPFMGSGTAGVAAKNLGRDFIGIELDPDYFGIAQERIEAI